MATLKSSDENISDETKQMGYCSKYVLNYLAKQAKPVRKC